MNSNAFMNLWIKILIDLPKHYEGVGTSALKLKTGVKNPLLTICILLFEVEVALNILNHKSTVITFIANVFFLKA